MKKEWIEDQTQPIDECSTADLRQWEDFLNMKIADSGAGSYDLARLGMIQAELHKRETYERSLPS